MARISTALLLNTCTTLNNLCGTPCNYHTINANNDRVASVGHYFIDGCELNQVTAEHGGYSRVYYGSRSELLAYMDGMIRVLRNYHNQHKTAA
jgi:hypothetical protein